MGKISTKINLMFIYKVKTFQPLNVIKGMEVRILVVQPFPK